MKITELVDLLVDSSNKSRVLYNGTLIGISTEEDVIKIYNAYYFREHLKKAGFVWDSEQKAWVGTIKELSNMEKDILTRFLETTSMKSIINLIKATLRTYRSS